MSFLFFKTTANKKLKTPDPAEPGGLVDVAVSESLRLAPSNYQHIGARENQEDAFAFSDLSDRKLVQESGVLAVLADGMGGLSRGEKASRTAVSVFLREFAARRGDLPVGQRLRGALVVANTSVFDLAFNGAVDEELGTTLTAVVIRGEQLHWISAGDSRVYLYRGGGLKQLTVDHIYANHLQQDVDSGRITQKEADEHPERAYLTSYLGLPEVMEFDQNDSPLLLKHGDRVLLCSDGLYDTLSEEQVAAVLDSASRDPAEALVNRALDVQNRYQDNITVIVLSILSRKGVDGE